MRVIDWTSYFKRDYRRVVVGRDRASIDPLLRLAVTLLIADEPLPPNYRDRALSGHWSDYRNCHLRHDLVLIYCKDVDATLQLVRLGSHSELGL